MTGLFLVAFYFAVGHGLLAIYKEWFRKILTWLILIKSDDVEHSLKEQQSHILLKKLITTKFYDHPSNQDISEKSTWGTHDLRNVALTSSHEEASLGRRFMFIALLNQGLGTALFLLALDFIVCLSGCLQRSLIMRVLCIHGCNFLWWWYWAFALSAVVMCFQKEPCAPLSALPWLNYWWKSLMINQPEKNIYLAGGFVSGWQKIAHKALPGFELLDPSSHSLEAPSEYTEWDLSAISQSDMILANMESTNPGGYA